MYLSKLFPLVLATLAFVVAPLAHADALKIPKDGPAASVDVPASWKPEETDRGYMVESPDQVVTLSLDVVAAKEFNTLIGESVDWLKEQGVKVDVGSKQEKDFEESGRKWSRVSWDADHKEWGAAVVGFAVTPVGGGKILTVTYWISKKDAEKNLDAIQKIFASVKSVE